MSRMLGLVIILFFLMGLDLYSKEYPSITRVGKITSVVDGDTVKIRSMGKRKTVKFRVAGIDTPESVRNEKLCKQVYECRVKHTILRRLGKDAKKYLASRITKNKPFIYDEYPPGYFGRPIIYFKNHIIEDLVSKGYAQVYRGSKLNPVIMDRLYRLEKQARKNKLGIWKYISKPCL